MKAAKLFYTLAIFLLLCLAPASGQAFMIENAEAGYRLELPEGWEKMELAAEQQTQFQSIIAGTPVKSLTVEIFINPADQLVLVVVDGDVSDALSDPDWRKHFMAGMLESMGVPQAEQKIVFSQHQAKSRMVFQGVPTAVQVNFIKSHAVIMLGLAPSADKTAELEMLMGKIRTKTPGSAPNAPAMNQLTGQESGQPGGQPDGQTGGQTGDQPGSQPGALPTDKPGLVEMFKFVVYCLIGVGIGMLALHFYKKKFGSNKK